MNELPGKVSDLLELEFQEAWVIGSERGSLVKAVCAINSRPITLVPQFLKSCRYHCRALILVFNLCLSP